MMLPCARALSLFFLQQKRKGRARRSQNRKGPGSFGVKGSQNVATLAHGLYCVYANDAASPGR
jgi:hypothetical protein